MSDDVRSIPKRMPSDWSPPVPAWSAQAPKERALCIAYYGIQVLEGTCAASVSEFRSWFQVLLRLPDAPANCEYAEFIDSQGYYTWLAIAYWQDANSYDRWSAGAAHQNYWSAPQRLQGAGVFREVLQVPGERIEMLQSNFSQKAGAARVCPVPHEPVREHNYWGGMRDRLAISGQDPLLATDPQALSNPSVEGLSGRHVRIRVPGNVAVIRSGQDFSDLQGDEWALYSQRIEPALRDGMDFLARHGQETGCLSSRLLRETDAMGHRLSRSFGLAHFVSLQHLEDWARSHPTHLRIYNEFLAMAQALGGQLQLRLWHEVAVLPAHEQVFEYLNCHAGTGLMAHAGVSTFISPHDSGVQA
ncbi:phenylacetaldoxime dehydratase family protein [Pseudomonas koreensis]|uniref:Phenylacetaldoxime dehydratase family protein n=1 Tax=Pseudomonas koreensis TaxID=198620 RepID=A0A9X2XKF6_9PSED|nr:phenylacetaldoxime dehydratase family protein [Pseudomonas koreensis]MCU7250899.1 phenylacetaldoxime dehydratase family protein [Pseudomonas koreensis]